MIQRERSAVWALRPRSGGSVRGLLVRLLGWLSGPSHLGRVDRVEATRYKDLIIKACAKYNTIHKRKIGYTELWQKAGFNERPTLEQLMAINARLNYRLRAMK